MIRGRTVALRFGVVAIAVVSLLGGCSPIAAEPILEADAISVSIFQNRSDYGIRQLEVKVSNSADRPITVTRARFESTNFSGPSVWERPEKIPAGAARDLRMQLADPVCDGEPSDPLVTVDFIRDDGSSSSIAVVPTDEHDRITAINNEDCLDASLSAIARITASDDLGWTPGDRKPAVLTIGLEPTGSDGVVILDEARGTVLLSLADEAETPVTATRIGATVRASEPTAFVQLLVIPNRCDPHAIAEDKRGTFFPLQVTVGDRNGVVYVAASDTLRSDLYGFYADYCDLPR